MRVLFPERGVESDRLPDRRLWQAMAEVVGQIDSLVERGQAEEVEDGDSAANSAALRLIDSPGSEAL